MPPHGWAGAPERLINCLSYFTELSNIMVAIISTILARRGCVGAWGRATHLCALMMITVTAIVYHFLIRPTEVLSGWSVLTNPLQHVVVPLLMVVVALACGPRGGVSGGVVLKALVIPIVWMIYTLVRGAFVHQYPYDFRQCDGLGIPAGMHQYRRNFVRGAGISRCDRWDRLGGWEGSIRA